MLLFMCVYMYTSEYRLYLFFLNYISVLLSSHAPIVTSSCWVFLSATTELHVYFFFLVSICFLSPIAGIMMGLILLIFFNFGPSLCLMQVVTCFHL